jgi:predicted RNA-binding protein
MCLAAAYQGAKSDQPVLQDIARMTVNGDSIELETLLGDKKVIHGKLKEIDFMESRIIIEG